MVPTGVALRDPREQLFEAAERILLRDGPNALTSRAVTAEAGCAKGVLHRHFADFDAFLLDLVLEHVAHLDNQAAALREAAGTGTVAGNLTGAMSELLGPVALALIRLVIARDELRLRLRQARSPGLPIVSEATKMIADYLDAERHLGRIATDADVATLAPTLIGAGSMLFTDREAGPPDAQAVGRMVSTILAGVLPRRRT
jgi:AcrR family transcriptional regulator